MFCETNRVGSRFTGEIRFDVPADATEEQITEIRDTEIFGWMCEQIELGHIGDLEQIL